MMFTEVKELVGDEESLKGNALKQSKGPSVTPPQMDADDGDWDNLSELNKSNELGELNKSNELGEFNGVNNLNLLGAIQQAKG